MISMCEFRVILDGKQLMEEVIYAKIDGNNIILRDIIGDEKTVENTTILEVNVLNTQMTLQHLYNR